MEKTSQKWLGDITKRQQTDEATSKAKNRYECSECKDVEWILDENNNATRCKCAELKAARAILINSGIKEGDRQKTFSNFKHSNFVNINKAKENAMQYYKEFESIENLRNNSIAFVGLMAGNKKLGVGTGKTHLAIALTMNLLNKGIPVKYFSYRDEVSKIKQSVTDKENYQRELDRWKNCRVLFIDDLFKGKITESDINIMFEIINHRYLNYKPIIVTSEYNIAAIDDIDQAIASRIYEMSKEHFNEMGGSGANYRYN